MNKTFVLLFLCKFDRVRHSVIYLGCSTDIYDKYAQTATIFSFRKRNYYHNDVEVIL